MVISKETAIKLICCSISFLKDINLISQMTPDPAPFIYHSKRFQFKLSVVRKPLIS